MRGSGRNHRRQMVQGLFRNSGIVNDPRHHPWRYPCCGSVSEEKRPGLFLREIGSAGKLAGRQAGSFLKSTSGSVLASAEGLTYFWRLALGAELDEEFVEVLAGELPFEGLSRGCPVVLKLQEALSDSVEVGKIIRGQDLPLDDREVDFDLVEPTGMNRRMHQRQAGVAIP